MFRSCLGVIKLAVYLAYMQIKAEDSEKPPESNHCKLFITGNILYMIEWLAVLAIVLTTSYFNIFFSHDNEKALRKFGMIFQS